MGLYGLAIGMEKGSEDDVVGVDVGEYDGVTGTDCTYSSESGGDVVDAKPCGDVGGAPRGNEVGGTDVGVDGVDDGGLLGTGMKGGLGFGTGE